MTIGIALNPNVLAFDETPEQFYINRLAAGVQKVGGIALPYSDLDIALEDFDSLAASAVVTTMSPDHSRTERLALADILVRPLIEIAHEHDIPLALVTEHPVAQLLVRDETFDAIFRSGFGEANALDNRVADWLGRLSTGTQLSFEITQAAQVRTPERVKSLDDVQSIFGSEVKMLVGAWVAGRTLEDGDFYQDQIVKALGLSPSGISTYLRMFCKLGMLTRDGVRTVYYRKTNSPLWKIFEPIVDILNDETR